MPRAVLAKQLGLDKECLLVLEMGEGLPEDITPKQLMQLEKLIEQTDPDGGFSELVQAYLATYPDEPDDSSL